MLTYSAYVKDKWQNWLNIRFNATAIQCCWKSEFPALHFYSYDCQCGNSCFICRYKIFPIHILSTIKMFQLVGQPQPVTFRFFSSDSTVAKFMNLCIVDLNLVLTEIHFSRPLLVILVNALSYAIHFICKYNLQLKLTAWTSLSAIFLFGK